jgi:transcriptional regulator with XRE-family HTH domain
MSSMTIGERVKDARQKAGLTQKQVGELLGYASAQTVVAHWEAGTVPIPRDKLKPLAKILQIDPVDLIP